MTERSRRTRSLTFGSASRASTYHALQPASTNRSYEMSPLRFLGFAYTYIRSLPCASLRRLPLYSNPQREQISVDGHNSARRRWRGRS